MLGKVCLRRNDFLFFHSERCLKGEITPRQPDYLLVFSPFVANKSAVLEAGHVINYVEY